MNLLERFGNRGGGVMGGGGLGGAISGPLEQGGTLGQPLGSVASGGFLGAQGGTLGVGAAPGMSPMGQMPMRPMMGRGNPNNQGIRNPRRPPNNKRQMRMF